MILNWGSEVSKMKLKPKTINELGGILEKEFNIKLGEKVLNEFAYFLVSFFGTMVKFENPPIPSIDNNKTKTEDKEGK